MFEFDNSTHYLLCVYLTIFLFLNGSDFWSHLFHILLICLPLGASINFCRIYNRHFLCSCDQPTDFFFFFSLRQKKSLWHCSSLSSGAFCLVRAEHLLCKCCTKCVYELLLQKSLSHDEMICHFLHFERLSVWQKRCHHLPNMIME